MRYKTCHRVPKKDTSLECCKEASHEGQLTHANDMSDLILSKRRRPTLDTEASGGLSLVLLETLSVVQQASLALISSPLHPCDDGVLTGNACHCACIILSLFHISVPGRCTRVCGPMAHCGRQHQNKRDARRAADLARSREKMGQRMRERWTQNIKK